MRAELTERQRRVYRYLIESIERDGRQPTLRELAAHFGIASPEGIACHLRALEGKGFIARLPNTAGVRLLRVKFRAIEGDGPQAPAASPGLPAEGRDG